MKEREYGEGPEAQENFERGMKALFKVPKADIVQRKIYFCGVINFSGFLRPGCDTDKHCQPVFVLRFFGLKSMNDVLGGLVDRPEFWYTKFREGFLYGGDAAKFPAQTIRAARMLTQNEFRD